MVDLPEKQKAAQGKFTESISPVLSLAANMLLSNGAAGVVIVVVAEPDDDGYSPAGAESFRKRGTVLTGEQVENAALSMTEQLAGTVPPGNA